MEKLTPISRLTLKSNKANADEEALQQQVETIVLFIHRQIIYQSKKTSTNTMFVFHVKDWGSRFETELYLKNITRILKCLEWLFPDCGITCKDDIITIDWS